MPAVQPPETWLADDVARVRHLLTRQDGPTVLVAHSCGDSALGTDAPNVVGLSTSRASASTRALIGACSSGVLPPRPFASIDIDERASRGFPRDDFLNHFASDIDPVKAKVMYAVQRSLHLSTFDDVMGTPAWNALPPATGAEGPGTFLLGGRSA